MKNKMKKKWLGVALLTTLIGSSFAGDHSGVRGGGHVIEVNGQLELVDVVSNATCDWFAGQELIKYYPAIEQTLKKIEKLDWYLALELRREIEFISWCMTGNLYSVPASDNDSFVQQLTKGVQQAAFRYNGSAYIDQTKFSRLNSSSQAYLIFHEMLHSYLPMNLEMRIFKLQSLLSTVRKVDLGQIKTRESLHLNLAKNEMDFPLTVSKLEPYKNSIQFILSSLENRVEAILSNQGPEKLIHPKIKEALPFVAEWDREAIFNAEVAITTALAEIFRSQDLKQVKYVLNDQTYQKINPAAVALTVYQELSPQIQKEVTSSTYFSKIIQQGSDFLNGISFSIANGRIVGDLALQSLSGNCKASAPSYTTSLILRGDKCQLPAKIQAIADIMVNLVETEDDAFLEKQLEQNSDLIRALRMESAIDSLNKMDPVIVREKSLAREVVKNLQTELVHDLIEQVNQRISRSSPVIERIFKKLK